MKHNRQRILTVCLMLAFILLLILSIIYTQMRPPIKMPEKMSGDYLYACTISCVDESGKLLKEETLQAYGTSWSFAPPKIDGYVTECASISFRDISNWVYPNSHYVRKASGSIQLVYSAVNG